MATDLNKIRAENRAKTAARTQKQTTQPPSAVNPPTDPQLQPTSPIQQPEASTQNTIMQQPAASVEQTSQPDYISIGNGKGVRRSSPQFKALVASGMTEEQIVAKLKSKQNGNTAPVAPVETAKPQPVEQQAPVEQAPAQPQQVNNQLPDFQDDSQQRQSEIIANLNTYKQTNPGMFADRALFEKSFSYGQRSDLQKSLLDNWYRHNVDKSMEASTLSRVPSTDVADKYVTGEVSDSDLNILQQQDPNKYAEVQKKIEEKRSIEKYSSLLYGSQEENTPSFATNVMSKIDTLLSSSKSPDFYDEYQKEISSPEVTNLMNDVTDIEGEIKQTNEEINATKSELEKQFAGSGMSQGRINAIIQDQVQLLQNKVNSLNIKYQTASDRYNNKMSSIKDALEMKEKSYAMQMQQEQSMVQKLSFAYGIYSDQQKRQDAKTASDLQFKRDMEVMNIKYERDFAQAIKLDKLQNGDINSADPYLVEKAIGKNVDQMMQQYDGLITSSRDQLIGRIQEGIKSGKKYGTVLGEIMKDIQAKPEYKQRRNNKLGIESKPVSLGGGLLMMPDGSMTTVDAMTAKLNPTPEITQQILKTVQAERLANGQSQYDNYSVAQACLAEVGTQGGQCGAFVNNIFQSNGGSRLFTNTITEKIAVTKQPGIYSPIPVVGGAVVIDNGASYTDNNGKQVNAGHVAIVTGVNSDGTFDYVDSNGKAGKEKVGLNKGVSIRGNMYFTSAPGKQPPAIQTVGGASPLSDDQRTIFNNQLSSFRSNAVVKQFEDAMTNYSNIKTSLENPSGPGDIAAIFMFMKSLDPTSVVRETEFNTAASSAGVSDKIGNALQKLQNGKQLTETQRTAFTALAKKFIENRATSYNRLYDDMTRVIDNSKIDRSYLPTRASDILKQSTDQGQNASLGINSYFSTPMSSGVGSAYSWQGYASSFGY